MNRADGPLGDNGAFSRRQAFDAVADTYVESLGRSVGRFGEDPGDFVHLKVDLIRAATGSRAIRTIVDIGCGVGLLTERLARAWPETQIVGFDPSARSLEYAAARCRDLANVSWRLFDGTNVPAEVEPADVAVVANVLHHLRPPERPAFLRRVLRPMVAPEGQVIIFEHNPYNPLTRLVVRSCPYDRDASLLTRRTATALLSSSGMNVVQATYILFFPRILKVLRPIEKYLRWLPVGAQYMVVGHRGGR